MADELITADPSFLQLGLSDPLLRALADVGYEAPTPVQAATIPPLLAGRDLIGQAQTGTGKTAAFALPLLAAVDSSLQRVQGLVLVPTRELALQVAEAVHTYAKYLERLSVLPVYGGQPFPNQLRGLQRGAQVVVGTPGRVMDHLRRGSLKLDATRLVVLDEADEMLRMGFLEDVEWILSQAPEGRQTALFSATMPAEIRRIAKAHLRDPLTVELAHRILTVPSVEQRYLNLAEGQKVDALTRILGAEPSEAVLVFTRTKTGAAELAQKLEARGWAAEALHGDLSQVQREALVRRLRARKVEVVVATDVAARGLDVEHITHVVNYDIPYDVEAYVHRIGRTGRAGRSGVAVLFVTPREIRMMREIERFTGKRLEAMRLPTRADVASRTVALFKQTLRDTLQKQDMEVYLNLVEELALEGGFDMAEVAAAAARLALGDKPIEVAVEPEPAAVPQPEEGMVRLFVAAGSRAGVRPADVVGAIANEAGVPGREIGSIDIYENFTFVELPRRYQAQVLQRMARSTIRGRPVNLRLASEQALGGKRGNTSRPQGWALPKRDRRPPKGRGRG
ncbi:MAG: DEAD/DEAH box helicase [Proteobacteria bacterium]|nr:DEAD/DEAH box helicase [Pseudomonadota bacterium]